MMPVSFFQIRRFRITLTAPLLAIALCSTGCSIRSLAINKLGNALAGESDVFASDDDPELIGDAIPFSLKFMESVLAENPKHAGLLMAASRGFTQYAYGWVQNAPVTEAEGGEAHQLDRARRLYLRARDYGLRGLEVRRPGFERALRSDPAAAMHMLSISDVPSLYWTAASWGLAISLSKDRPEVLADLPLVGAMVDRALELDEHFGNGAIHSFLISYEGARAGGEGDPLVRARKHFDRAVELSGGTLASPFVTFAETISVQTQNRSEFEELLHRATAIDADAKPQSRLENLIAQRRARWLLAHADELFLEESQGEKK